jgi:hypothetical protein
MKLIPTELPGVMLVETHVFADDRGWFMESFNAAQLDTALKALGSPQAPAFVQDNHSCSRGGVLRGLHYQLPPHAQGKLVRVVKGKAWDVAVDIRRGSTTFGCWVGTELGADNRRQRGFRRALRTASWRWKTTRTSSTRPPTSMRRNANAASAGTTRHWPSPGPWRRERCRYWQPRTPRPRCWRTPRPSRIGSRIGSTSQASLREALSTAPGRRGNRWRFVPDDDARSKADNRVALEARRRRTAADFGRSLAIDRRS